MEILWIILGIIGYIISVIFCYKMMSLDYYKDFGMTLTEGNEKYPMKSICILMSLIPYLNIIIGIACIPISIEKINLGFLRKIFDKIEYKKKD